tara:strand:+ start:1730 stop:2587 length:858 start_codon:yes stop_codon:yes gene_type:complete
MTYAITGSTGHLGSLVIDHLISGGTAPSSIVAIARSREKAAPLADRGVEVRIADYDQPDTLGPALSGIDRLLLISGSDPGRRAAQHRAVIEAAVRQTVGFLAYTSITRADTSNHVLAPDHKTTEELIRRSGIPSAMLRNNWYAENFAQDVEAARSTGVIEAAAGDGRIASALRSEYAEAAARVLQGTGHENAVYELAGPVWDYHDLAAAVSDVLGRTVEYRAVSPETRRASLLAVGADEQTAGFVVALDESTAAGELDIERDDLATLIGREPLALRAAMESVASA